MTKEEMLEHLAEILETNPVHLVKQLNDMNELRDFFFTDDAKMMAKSIIKEVGDAVMEEMINLSDKVTDLIESKLPNDSEEMALNSKKRVLILITLLPMLLGGRISLKKVKDVNECKTCPDRNGCTDSTYSKCQDFEPKEEDVNAQTVKEIMEESNYGN